MTRSAIVVRVFFLAAVLAACGPTGGDPDQAVGSPRAAAPEPLGFDQIPLSQAADRQASDRVSGGEDDTGGELSGERAMQRDLPMVRGGVWDTLRTTTVSIDEVSQMFVAVHSPAVRALAGRSITLRGYMLPLEASDRTTHFLISPYTPVCFFHPPAEPNEVVEVALDRPIEAGYHLVEVTGVLHLENNGEKGLFFVMDQARGRVLERIVE